MNTILITVDALRADHVGQYGYHRDTMPVLDTLIEDGLKYQPAVSNGSYTKKSIPSFLTSKINGGEYIENGPTIATSLKELGIYTVGIHSNSWISTDFGQIDGFDELIDFSEKEEVWSDSESSPIQSILYWFENRYGESLSRSKIVRKLASVIPEEFRHESTPYVDAEITTQTAIECIAQLEQGGDYFLWVHYMDPHRPYGISDKADKYLEDPMPDSEIQKLMSKAGVSPDSVSNSENRTMINLYDSDIAYTSEKIMDLIKFLKETGQYDESNIFFTADHGEEFGEHGMYFHRNKPYRELVEVPFIFKPSDSLNTSDLDSAERRQLLDLYPTIAEIHNIEASNIDGKSLYRSPEQNQITLGYIGDKTVVSVTDGEWKVFKNLDNSEVEIVCPENVTEQPDRVNSLISSIPEEVLTTGTEEDQPTNTDEATKDRLKQLGYLE
jgi:arylsulfatase A-like enzyme